MIATLKKSAKEQAKSKAESNRELIMILLEWDSLQYGNFLMQCAEDYLKMQCGPDVYGIELLMGNRLFWNWWCNHWSRIDNDFIAKWADYDNLNEVVLEYEFAHSARNMHFRPHRVVMEQSYMKMVQEVINTERYV